MCYYCPLKCNYIANRNTDSVPLPPPPPKTILTIILFPFQKWLKRDTGFAGFIETQESRPECCYLKLPALLITPIQRIPRYCCQIQVVIHVIVYTCKYVQFYAV